MGDGVPFILQLHKNPRWKYGKYHVQVPLMGHGEDN
jgi:hypothetical protein